MKTKILLLVLATVLFFVPLSILVIERIRIDRLKSRMNEHRDFYRCEECPSLWYNKGIDLLNYVFPGLIHPSNHLFVPYQLDINYCTVTGELPDLSGFPYLREIHANEADISDDKLIQKLGRQPRLEAVWARNTSLTDRSMDWFSKIPTLGYLDLVGCPIGDEGVLKLNPDSSLEALYLRKTLITDRSLDHLSKFKNLGRLSVAYCPGVTLARVHQFIKENPQVDLGWSIYPTESLEESYPEELKTIQASWSDLNDDMLKQKLVRQPYVESVWARHTRLTDQSMNWFSKTYSLWFLDLEGCQIGDEGVLKLDPYLHPYSLNLNETLITDRSLDHLSKFKHLEFLGVANCSGVTLSRVHQFMKENPKVKLEWSKSPTNLKDNRAD